MKFYRTLLVFLSLVLFASCNTIAQQPKHETDASIPALADFHEVIYPIWHEAFPEKNIKSLKEFSDSVKNSAEKIYEAKLPGILRDKETKWNEGIAKFKTSVDEYVAAAKVEDDSRLLNAAEALHSNYEGLVRIIRPVLKEVDEYHKDLYMIFHHYIPNKEIDKVKTIADGLKIKAGLLVSAKLPTRLAGKQDSYNKSVEELIVDTDLFIETLAQEDFDLINKALDKMHTSYQKLEAVFN